MSSVDNRVVEMEFDNKQFESGVATTIKSLTKLKSGLKNLQGSEKTFDNIGSSTKKLQLEDVASDVQTIASRFSTLGVIATTTLANIATAAVNTGARLIKSFTLDPITQGFSEYELQLNSIQTILANTRSKGTNLDQVNAALDELNTYADKTIYNFAQMTENIGRFTAAGVDLDKSVSSIKGISNLAALSGSTPAQAASAMYQLSQAIAAGRIQLMDWNSVVNAGMGGEQFQEALKRTARNFGINVDGMIEKYGSFRESLTRGEWLTSDVLTETLKQISGAYTEADLLAQGYSADQAKAILELAQSAEESATKIRTFTQLTSTAMESLGSGWAKTWQILFGDFEESTELWSEVGNAVTGAINQMSDARNNLLQGWKDLGGRTDILDGLRAAFEGLGSILTTVGDAFRKVFPPTTSEQLKSLSQGFKDLMTNLKPSEATLDRVSRAAEGFFSVLDLGKQAVEAILAPIGRLLGSDGFAGLISVLLGAAATVGDFFTAINNGAKEGNVFGGIASGLSGVADGIGLALGTITSSIESASGIFEAASQTIGDAISFIGEKLGEIFGWISGNVTFGDVMTGLVGGAALSAFQGFEDLIDKISGALDKLPFIGSEGATEAASFSSNLSTVGNAISEFINMIRVGSFIGIAVAVGVLANAVRTLSEIPIDKLATGLIGVAGAFLVLRKGFVKFMTSIDGLNVGGVVKTSVAMIAMAKAVEILSDAVKTLSDLPIDKLATGLVGVGVGLGELVAAVKIIGDTKVSLKTSAAILALAKACDMLADAVVDLSKLSFEEVARGLIAMGGALAELVIAVKALSKFGGLKSLIGAGSILVAVQALDEISQALDSLSKLSWDEIGRGLAAMGGALAEIGLVTGGVGKFAGLSGLVGGGSIVLAVQSLDEISQALDSLSKLSWDEIGRGLTAMGGALTEIGVVSGLLGKLTGIAGLVGAGTITLASQGLTEISEALTQFGEMSWDEIGQGLVAMGGALTEIGVVSGLLGNLTGIAGLVGAGTITLATTGLQQLYDGFSGFGSLSWDEIWRGLVGMGGALTEIGVVSGLLGNLAGIAGLVGAGTITLATTGLQQLYDGFSSFGSLSWEEIGTGLVAMGGALAELGAISGATGILTGIAGLVGAGTITLASQGLGDLADAFKKFSSMDWESVKTGLVAMGAAMGETALGSLLNTFSGFGAGALATIAEPLGTLADSVKKWAGVTVPEGLGTQLGSLAGGVQAFTFSGFGAGSIATVAEPLGTLAKSVGEWSSITIPEGLGDKLSDLARGVNAFTLSFFAGGSIPTIIDPLKNLAGAVKEWKSVKFPDNIGEKLSDLAGGVNAFALTGFTSGGANSAAEPLKNLAGAVKKWNGVTVPANIKTSLENLSGGVKSFSDMGDSISTLGSVGDSLKKLASATSTMMGVDFGTISTSLQNFATTITDIPSQITTSISDIQSAFAQLGIAITVGVSTIPSMIQESSTGISGALGSIAASVTASSLLINLALQNLMVAGIESVNVQAVQLATAGTNATTLFSSAFNVGMAAATILVNSSITSMFLSLIQTATSQFNAAKVSFTNFGTNIGKSLATGLDNTRQTVQNAAEALGDAAASGARKSYSGFKATGEYLAAGLARGIRSGRSTVISAASSVASDALRAANSALGVESPSKEFAKTGMYSDMGLAQGFLKYGRLVEDAATAVADKSLSAMQLAMKEAGDPLGSSVNTPHITPVIDYSKSDFDRMDTNRTLSVKGNVDFGAFTTATNSLIQTVMKEQQATRESNQRVIDEISGLREDLSNLMNADSSEIGLYVDGRKLASSLAGPINRELNILSRRGGLGK